MLRPRHTGVACVALVLVLLVHTASAQWAFGTPKFVEVFAENKAATHDAIISGPYVVEQLNPGKFLIDINTYQCVSRVSPPAHLSLRNSRHTACCAAVQRQV